jgi:hypothetical protein
MNIALTFRNKAWEHLSKYKENTLHINYEYKINYKGKEIIYKHFLPKEDKYLNILPSFYHDIIKNELLKSIEEKKLSLHDGFTHLNSSQALCFNLFYPILIEKEYSFIYDHIQNNDTEYAFEYVEDKNEETNFDLFINNNNRKYYFEIKYTEENFGSTQMDERHLEKYENIYKQKLSEFNGIDINTFKKYYQLFRNIMYCSNGITFFVFSNKRKDLEKVVNKAKERYCNENQRENIKILFIEEIINKIMETSKNKNIKEH